jgi:hypothetical protein
MLRRPPTLITLTAEDVAAYEDKHHTRLADEERQRTASTHSGDIDTGSRTSFPP